MKKLLKEVEDVKELESKFKQLIKDWNLREDDFMIDISSMKSFEIKTGFFTKGIYYKRSNERRKAASISGKENILRFKEFFGR